MLGEIGAAELPRLIVLNKIDALDPLARRRVVGALPDALQVSALTGEGLDDLQARIAEQFQDRFEPVRLLLPYDEGAKLAELYELGAPGRRARGHRGGRARPGAAPAPRDPPFAEFLVADADSHEKAV